MESFEELGVTPELVDALTAEGIEVPTEFQGAAIPVLLRGNPLLAQAGPGAGTLIAYGFPSSSEWTPRPPSPRALVLASSTEAASRLAASLSRLAQITGHRVGALESGWALPELASILFATPEDLLRAVRGSQFSLEEVQAVVVDGFSGLQAEEPGGPGDHLRVPTEGRPEGSPGPAPLRGGGSLSERPTSARPSTSLPRQPRPERKRLPLRRGEVSYRIASEGKEPELLQTVAAAFWKREPITLLLFFRTEDQAADVGDFLTLHGYQSGAPGDTRVSRLVGRRRTPGQKGPWTDGPIRRRS